jgi:type IV pilus assembly protein PilQ
MRLKQLLSIPVGMILMAAMAYGSVAELTGVSVSTTGESTVVTLKASGAFTHNEYRPDDKVFLVDLSGVSSASLKDKSRTLSGALLKSYSVYTFKGASGVSVTRVELVLGDSVAVDVNADGSAIKLRLAGNAAKLDAAGQTAAKPETVQASDAPEAVRATTATAAPAIASAQRLHSIQKLSVRHAAGSSTVEVEGSNEAKALLLDNPRRLVLDFAGAVPAPVLRKGMIDVNTTEIKDIRVARYQLDPPVTRVVLDLSQPCDYELTPDGRNLQVKINARREAVLQSQPAPAGRQQPSVTTHDAAPLPAATPVAATTAPAPVAKPIPAAAPSVAAVEKKNTLAQEPVLMAAATPSEPLRTAATQEDRSLSIVDAKPVITQSSGSEGVRSDASVPTAASFAVPAKNLALEQRQEQASSKPDSKPKYVGEPISINVVDADIRQFFRLIHDISGLNIVVDPGVHGSITLALDDVPWDQALDIVLRNNSLDKQLEGNVLRIASYEALKNEDDLRNAQKQAQLLVQPKVTVTRFLNYAKAGQIVNTLGNFKSKLGSITVDERTNSLIISDIESVIPDLDKLLAQLDRKTQEVEIQVRVVSATRTFSNSIGVTLGLSGTAAGQSITGSPAVGTSATSALPLFSNQSVTGPTSGLGLVASFGTFKLDGELQMAEAHGLAKVLSRPYVVAQNNMPAEVDQGARIPTVVSSTGSSVATVSYIDAMLKMVVTPQITVEGTIFLNVSIENSTPDFSKEVDGNPTINTQKATTQVLVRDGETAMIGGVIATTNSVTVSQFPVLGNLPLLGNLFRSRVVSTSTQELIFFITPRIIPI